MQLHQALIAGKEEEELRKVRFYSGDPDEVQKTTGQSSVTLTYHLGRTLSLIHILGKVRELLAELRYLGVSQQELADLVKEVFA